MSRHKDFDAARAEFAQEPLTFRLAGRDFTTLSEIPASVLLDLAAHHDKPLDGAALHLFGATIRGLVVPDQRDAMDAALSEVGIMAMVGVINWVMEELSGRPLPNASSSLEQQSKDGAPLSLAWRQLDEEARSA